MADKKEAILTEKAPAPVGPYSQAIRYGNLVFISGQIPMEPGTGNIPEGIEAQTDLASRNLMAVARAATPGDGDPVFLKNTIFLTDMGDFPVVNGIYEKYFGGEVPPARACVEVAALPRGVLVEIEGILGV